MVPPALVLWGTGELIHYSQPKHPPAAIYNPAGDISIGVTKPEIRTLTPPESWGEQYTLRAKADGLYPVFKWGKGQVGMQMLHRLDIWKIGTTMNGQVGRGYSENYLSSVGAGLLYVPEFYGTNEQLIFVERMKLLNYVLQNGGTLPPGNTKLQ